ncbi:hypothetical protein OG607_11295 [Streptomyces sp. NBC_01537]
MFLEHAGIDPDDPVQQRTRTILDGGWRSRVLPALSRLLAAP